MALSPYYRAGYGHTEPQTNRSGEHGCLPLKSRVSAFGRLFCYCSQMRIVVRGTNWIGDSVMAIPAMRRLRRSFPEAQIALHTRRWAEGIFRDADFLDEIIAFDQAGSKLKTVREQARLLKAGNFDLAVILPNSFESAATVRLAGIPRRFGYKADRRGFLLSDPFPVPGWKNEQHESEYYLNLVGFVEKQIFGSAVVVEPEPVSLNVSDKRRDEAIEILRSLGVDASKRVVGFGSGSTNSLAKRWPAERFALLSDKFADELGSQVVLLGSEGEQGVADEVKRIAKHDLIDLTGRTDLAQATALLSVLDLFVSNDMGLAHIAGAVGTPTLTIFGPTNETTTRPLGNRVTIMREPVECAPCMLRECPIDHRCMTGIKPEMVFETAVKMLENRTEK